MLAIVAAAGIGMLSQYHRVLELRHHDAGNDSFACAIAIDRRYNDKWCSTGNGSRKRYRRGYFGSTVRRQ